jgi:toxin ParE1/3/4
MSAVRILEAAAAEAAGAAAWYESQRAGLGADFREDFRAGLGTLQEGVVPGSPCPGHLGERGVKRILLKWFPFSVGLSTPAAVRSSWRSRTIGGDRRIVAADWPGPDLHSSSGSRTLAAPGLYARARWLHQVCARKLQQQIRPL